MPDPQKSRNSLRRKQSPRGCHISCEVLPAEHLLLAASASPTPRKQETAPDDATED
jgi:hypothetical protein